jgi:hypothetical protein
MIQKLELLLIMLIIINLSNDIFIINNVNNDKYLSNNKNIMFFKNYFNQ